MILFKNISKLYGDDYLALNNINLKIEDGEFIVLVGQSGAGKSTLMKLITGEEKPNQGEVYFGNNRIDTLKYHNIEDN